MKKGRTTLAIFFNFWILGYFITFTPKCFAAFALAMASAELRAILQNTRLKSAIFHNNFCAALLILRRLSNSAQNSARAESHNNTDIPGADPCHAAWPTLRQTDRQLLTGCTISSVI